LPACLASTHLKSQVPDILNTVAYVDKKFRYCEEHSASACLVGVLYDISCEKIC